VKGPVSGEEYRTSRTKGREFQRQSLLDEFSISEIWARERPETGCVSAETGSTLRGSTPIFETVARDLNRSRKNQMGAAGAGLHGTMTRQLSDADRLYIP
jgi:hypothetical protein